LNFLVRFYSGLLALPRNARAERLKHLLDFQGLAHRFEHFAGVSAGAVQPRVGARSKGDNACYKQSEQQLDVRNRFVCIGGVSRERKGDQETSHEGDDNQGGRLHGF